MLKGLPASALLFLVNRIFVAVLIVIFGIVAHAQYTKHNHHKLVNIATDKYPLAEGLLLGLRNDWVPKIWEEKIHSPNQVVASALKDANDRTDVFFRSGLDSAPEVFLEELMAWITFRLACDHFSTSKNSVEACYNREMETLPDNFQARFLSDFHDDLTLIMSPGVVHSQPATLLRSTLCNVAPVSARFQSLAKVADETLVARYRKILGIEIGTGNISTPQIVPPGQCTTIVQRAFLPDADLEPPLSRVSAADDNKLSWFHANYQKYHGTGSTSEKSISEQMVEAIHLYGENICAASTWPGPQNSGLYFDLSSSQCTGQSGQTFFHAEITDGLSTYQVASYPDYINGYSVLARTLDGFDLPNLAAAQDHARGFGAVVSRQYSLYQSWSLRQPRFFLTENDTHNLLDYNGPFEAGVRTSNLVNTTVLGEDIPTMPRYGTITTILSVFPDAQGQPGEVARQHAVLSVYDVYETLEHHGSNTSLGIDAFIGVMIGNSSPIVTRHRFNTNARQSFPVGSAFIAGALNAAQFGGGTWTERQSYAYSKQVNPFAVGLGEMATVVAVEILISRGLRGFFKLPKSGKIGLTSGFRPAVGLVTGIYSSGYTIATAPALEIDEVVAAEAQIAGGLGFALGYLMP